MVMAKESKKFKSILVANRGEIAIRVLRAAAELKLRTVALYSFEDRYSLHRYKADESYQIGPKSEPLKPYLDIEEIVQLARRKNIDAIHPGYGFLSENVEFARACEQAGVTFVGPSSEVMQQLGDKIRAKQLAKKLGVPVIEGAEVSVGDFDVASKAAEQIGYPILIKASAGGGGRGMRIVRDKANLEVALEEASKEALSAFGDGTIFLERFIESPRHIEVQLLGDTKGNLVHLFERDCSVQRRFQKVVEVAPCPSLSDSARAKLFEYALKLGNAVSYSNAGTVEFLVDEQENIYFIEVNPRIQVEHTVTEEITGIDIVRSQILIAQGYELGYPGIFLRNQEDIQATGFAIQCRITTEDPENNFMPDYGRIITYRSPGGFGIRLDAGSAYPGMKISPFFDSLLVKVTASGRTLRGACERLDRALTEFRVRGVKTNIPFLINVVSHPEFRSGDVRVNFLEKYPELFHFKRGRDRANKVLRYIGEVIVNGNPDVKGSDPGSIRLREPKIPLFNRYADYPAGMKQKLDQLGPESFCKWLSSEQPIHYTDTTFRDAHQSLLATRVRTIDMLRVAEGFARANPEVFSMEVWGGATFDVSMRFLHECPWQRLRQLRKAMPNMLLQMLLRGSNGVGYSAYPDNLIVSFVEKSAEEGIDIFRIFDSMNWFPNMELSIKTVRERTKAIAQASICYSGDLSNPSEDKYTLDYYLDLAKKLEGAGAHMLAIKDMAGLLKPRAAEQLIAGLKSVTSLPVHLHTHDTSSAQLATYLAAINAGVDVVDVALASMSGLTSQPNFNSLVAILEGHQRQNPIDLKSLNDYSNYWEAVRECYAPFESGLKSGTAEVYDHEIPGGQYSNLRPQAKALGLEDKFEEIKENYKKVDALLGRIIKVTPSSKVVGDLAQYLTANNIKVEDLIAKGEELSFPESLKGYFRGDLGQPYGGFPEQLQKIVLRDEVPYTTRPNEHLEPINLEEAFKAFCEKYPEKSQYCDFLSACLYPKVFEEFYKHQLEFGDVTVIPSPAFFYGLKVGEEVRVEIAEGKKLIIELEFVGEPDDEGRRSVSFKLNGQSRSVLIDDRALEVKKQRNPKATEPNQVGSPLQGKIAKVAVEDGEKVDKGQTLFVIEAMKMETTVSAPRAGQISKVCLSAGALVEQDDLVVEFKI